MPRSFQDALSSNVISPRIGSLALRYEDSLLIGQSEKANLLVRSWSPEFGLAAAVWCGLITLLFLLVPGGGYRAPAFTAALTATLLWATRQLEQRHPPPARFVLNFVAETLRIERQTRSPFRRKARTVPFDAVLSVQIERGPAPNRPVRLVLLLEAEKDGHKPERWDIAQRIPVSELEALQRFERFLYNAFGLGRGAGLS